MEYQFQFEVQYPRSLRQSVADAGQDWDNFLGLCERLMPREKRIISFAGQTFRCMKDETLDVVLKRMQSDLVNGTHWELAGIEHLLAFRMAYPDKYPEERLIAPRDMIGSSPSAWMPCYHGKKLGFDGVYARVIGDTPMGSKGDVFLGIIPLS